jgi:hypothetical protein
MPLKSVREGQMIPLHSIVAFFHKAKRTILAITYKINRVLGEKIISSSTVGKYVWMFVLQQKKQRYPSSSDRMVISVVTTTSPLRSHPSLFSVRQIAKKVMMSKSPVYRHLTQTMRWNLRHLKWVPHSLSECEKINRVQRGTELLELLRPIRRQG